TGAAKASAGAAGGRAMGDRNAGFFSRPEASRASAALEQVRVEAAEDGRIGDARVGAAEGSCPHRIAGVRGAGRMVASVLLAILTRTQVMRIVGAASGQRHEGKSDSIGCARSPGPESERDPSIFQDRQDVGVGEERLHRVVLREWREGQAELVLALAFMVQPDPAELDVDAP